MQNHTVYFIQPRSGGLIKIGVTSDIDRRLKELQTGQAAELRVVHKIVFDKRAIAERVEQLLHSRYAQYRSNGEWFDVSLAMIKADIEWAREIVGILDGDVNEWKHKAENYKQASLMGRANYVGDIINHGKLSDYTQEWLGLMGWSLEEYMDFVGAFWSGKQNND